MTKIPTLGVVGGGIWANHHMNAVRDLERLGQAKLVAMCARTNETVAKMTKEYGIEGTTDFRQLLARKDVTAVSIVTPDHLHREMAVEAMKAGKHVIVEKPMDVTVEGCQEMIQVAKDNGVLLFVDFHKRYDPVQQKAKDMVRQGSLGQIQYGNAYMEDKIVVPRDWFPTWAPKSSPFWFLGVHQVDTLRWTLGSEVVRVYAKGYSGKLKSLGIDTLDSVHAELQFDNGACVAVDVSWIIPENFEAVVNQGMRLVGTDGILEIDTQDRGFRGCCKTESTQTYNVNSYHRYRTAAGQFQHTGYFIEPVKEFMELAKFALNGGSVKDISGEYPGGNDGLEATRVAAAVQEALQQDKFIDIVR